jgi:phosphatidylethanolamine/phosphatidyl-N-methylethanolamine N-methyltransferase
MVAGAAGAARRRTHSLGAMSASSSSSVQVRGASLDDELALAAPGVAAPTRTFIRQPGEGRRGLAPGRRMRSIDRPVRDTLHFIGQIARNWRQTGAIVPSGPHLSKAMAIAAGDISTDQVVVELGPGTGACTEAILRHFPGRRVVAIEMNPSFAGRLRQRMPAVTVVEGCASRLPDHLAGLGIAPARIGAVVSGLPFLIMPPDLVRSILGAVAQVLPAERRFVQFTYAHRAWRDRVPDGFRPESPRRVWLNVPPAIVLPFVRR